MVRRLVAAARHWIQSTPCCQIQPEFPGNPPDETAPFMALNHQEGV